MANRIEGGGGSWWNCFCCCCSDSQPTSPNENDPLINEGGIERAPPLRRGSPQPSYSQYQTAQDVNESPMK